jgi:hypothetical protein
VTLLNCSSVPSSVAMEGDAQDGGDGGDAAGLVEHVGDWSGKKVQQASL